jgi:hypothetical protein
LLNVRGGQRRADARYGGLMPHLERLI